MFKTETHLHTAEVSRCGKKRAFAMMRAYKDAGYSTVCITDHFQANTLDALGDISWEDKITIFLSGYYSAVHEGKQLGMTALLGAEICFPGDPNHYLVYGLTKELLVRYENLHTYGIERLGEIAKQNGLLLVQAHPHRDGHCVPVPQYVDGFEVYNSNPRHEDMSDLSEAIAKENGLVMIGGSDAHRDEDVAGAGILTEEKIESSEQFIRLVREGRCEIIRQAQSPR